MTKETTLAITIGGEDISIKCSVDEVKSLEVAAELLQKSLQASTHQDDMPSKLLSAALSLARQVSELKLYKERTESVLRIFNTRLNALLEKYPEAAHLEAESSIS